jgi:hypothetical protein
MTDVGMSRRGALGALAAAVAAPVRFRGLGLAK